MQQPSIGRIVHYTLDDAPPADSDAFVYDAHVRAGVVTRVFDAGVNITLFLDGANDVGLAPHVYTRQISPAVDVEACDEHPAGTLDAGQLPHPGHWHWGV